VQRQEPGATEFAEDFRTELESFSQGQSDNEATLQLLQSWAVTNNLTRNAISELLKILKTHSCFKNFPSDTRTLLHTPTTTPTTAIGSGQFVYIGIKLGLLSGISSTEKLFPDCFNLQFNIDGIPLFRSSNIQLWPILGNVIGTPRIFPVAIFSGDQKPVDLDVFLGEFIQELIELEAVGLDINGRNIKVKTRALVCDAPARSFICSIKNHSGYYGCGKCEVKGKYVENRVVF